MLEHLKNNSIQFITLYKECQLMNKWYDIIFIKQFIREASIGGGNKLVEKLDTDTENEGKISEIMKSSELGGTGNSVVLSKVNLLQHVFRSYNLFSKHSQKF